MYKYKLTLTYSLITPEYFLILDYNKFFHLSNSPSGLSDLKEFIIITNNKYSYPDSVSISKNKNTIRI